LLDSVTRGPAFFSWRKIKKNGQHLRHNLVTSLQSYISLYPALYSFFFEPVYAVQIRTRTGRNGPVIGALGMSSCSGFWRPDLEELSIRRGVDVGSTVKGRITFLGCLFEGIGGSSCGASTATPTRFGGIVSKQRGRNAQQWRRHISGKSPISRCRSNSRRGGRRF
jgi:hypothetical protein